MRVLVHHRDHNGRNEGQNAANSGQGSVPTSAVHDPAIEFPSER